MVDELSPYPDLPTLHARFAEEGHALGGTVGAYGQSVEGRDLMMLSVPATADTERSVTVCANIHGIEYISSEVAFGVVRALSTSLGRGLRERAAVHVLYCLNPDGRARCAAAAGVGRVRDFRKNLRGVDLNRNFPRPVDTGWFRLPFTGSDDEDAATYRGPAEASEPEVSQLCTALDELRPWASVNLHSFMGTFIPPRVADRATYRTYARLCRAAAAAQGVRYRRLASHWFDSYTGEQEDHQHHVHKTWAVCVESFPVTRSIRQHLRAPSAFWRFNPRDVARWVDNDVPAVLAFLHAALDLPRPV